MSSRDAILKRIRTELADAPPVETPPVPAVWPCTNPTQQQLVEQFTEALQAVQGEMVRCGSMDDARGNLAELADASGWQTLGAVERPLCHELADEMGPDRVAWVDEDWEPSRIAGLSASIVAAESLLADTGTCVVENRTPSERLMCYLPPACVVVARVGQLTEHMPAAWEEVARRTAEPDRRGEFVLITGPSRTADIEKILILGVHGPKRLVVLLVE